jgi:hypothetical protein
LSVIITIYLAQFIITCTFRASKYFRHLLSDFEEAIILSSNMSYSKHIIPFCVAILGCTGLIAPSLRIKRSSTTQSFCLPESLQSELGRVDNKFKMNTGLASLLLATIFALGTPAVAAAVGGAPSVFTNDYSDPLHPLCERHVKVSSDGNAFHFSGTQGKPGCTQGEIKEFGISKKEFDGFVDGTKISAGDGIHEGVWEPANSAATKLGYEDMDGVRWEDGNKWIVKQKSPGIKIGETIFLAYIGFSTLAGVKGIADKVRSQQ